MWYCGAGNMLYQLNGVISLPGLDYRIKALQVESHEEN